MVEHEEYREMALLFIRFRAIYVLPKRTSGCTKTNEREGAILFQFADPADGKRNGLHAGEMKAYIQLCLAMSQLAKMVRTASPKPQQTDNEKYAMRCWMLRLGFIGDEFATAREILLRNMEGNASWRNK